MPLILFLDHNNLVQDYNPKMALYMARTLLVVHLRQLASKEHLHNQPSKN